MTLSRCWDQGESSIFVLVWLCHSMTTVVTEWIDRKSSSAMHGREIACLGRQSLTSHRDWNTWGPPALGLFQTCESGLQVREYCTTLGD